MVNRGQEQPAFFDRITKSFRITAAPADNALLSRFLSDAVFADSEINEIFAEIIQTINSVSSAISPPRYSHGDENQNLFRRSMIDFSYITPKTLP